jgi:hypothetical protein
MEVISVLVYSIAISWNYEGYGDWKGVLVWGLGCREQSGHSGRKSFSASLLSTVHFLDRNVSISNVLLRFSPWVGAFPACSVLFSSQTLIPLFLVPHHLNFLRSRGWMLSNLRL